MKKVTYLLMTLGLLLAMGLAEAGKPVSGERFFTEFNGPVFGSATSNSTKNRGNIANLVFNKTNSNVDFNLGSDFVGAVAGTPCFVGNYVATMHLLDDTGMDAELTARFWFEANGASYVLELFDTVPAWSDSFPPFDDAGTITRSAEYWQVRLLSGNGSEDSCAVSGDFGNDKVMIELCLESNLTTAGHCP